MAQKRIRPRRMLAEFTRDCEIVLRENDFKGNFKNCPPGYLWSCFIKEVFELYTALYVTSSTGKHGVRKECCDVSNFAMALSDGYELDKAGD